MPRLTAVEIKQMRVEILTEAFSQQEIANHFGVNRQTVHRHKKELDARPELRAKFQKQLHKIMIERDAKRDNEMLQMSQPSDIEAMQNVTQEIEDVTVDRAANMVADVIERHRQITQDAMIGIRGLQEAINAQVNTCAPADLEIKDIAQAQRQVSSSIVNIINCDRKSYNIDDPGAGDDAPDAVNITFYRDNVTKEIEVSP